jgi:hypothetical protein
MGDSTGQRLTFGRTLVGGMLWPMKSAAAHRMRKRSA